MSSSERSLPASSSAAVPDASERDGSQKTSCVPYFDALWFCYSPVYQMREYYRYGAVDDCTRHWGKLYNCLKLRTKFAEQVQGMERYANPMWEIRSREEAEEAWQREFGHLSEEDRVHGHPSGPDSEVSGADEAGGKTTNVGLA